MKKQVQTPYSYQAQYQKATKQKADEQNKNLSRKSSINPPKNKKISSPRNYDNLQFKINPDRQSTQNYYGSKFIQDNSQKTSDYNTRVLEKPPYLQEFSKKERKSSQNHIDNKQINTHMNQQQYHRLEKDFQNLNKPKQIQKPSEQVIQKRSYTQVTSKSPTRNVQQPQYSPINNKSKQEQYQEDLKYQEYIKNVEDKKIQYEQYKKAQMEVQMRQYMMVRDKSIENQIKQKEKEKLEIEQQRRNSRNSRKNSIGHNDLQSYSNYQKFTVNNNNQQTYKLYEENLIFRQNNPESYQISNRTSQHTSQFQSIKNENLVQDFSQFIQFLQKDLQNQNEMLKQDMDSFLETQSILKGIDNQKDKTHYKQQFQQLLQQQIDSAIQSSSPRISPNNRYQKVNNYM